MFDNVIALKIKKLEKLIDEEFEQIVVLEVRIRGRQDSMKTLPKDAERPLRVARMNSEIERFQDDINGREYTITTMKKMLDEYKKLEQESDEKK